MSELNDATTPGQRVKAILEWKEVQEAQSPITSPEHKREIDKRLQEAANVIASPPDFSWHIEEGDLTKLFHDAQKREYVRRLLDSVKRNDRFAIDARRKLAEIKTEMSNKQEPESVEPVKNEKIELTQAEIDQMQLKKGVYPVYN